MKKGGVPICVCACVPRFVSRFSPFRAAAFLVFSAERCGGREGGEIRRWGSTRIYIGWSGHSVMACIYVWV